MMAAKPGELKRLMAQALQESKDLNAKYAWDQEAIDFQDIQTPNDPDITEFSMQIPNDVTGGASSNTEDVGTALTTAPTTNPKRPRAYTIGYNPNTRTLIVIFRDNVWWQYNNVPADMWLGLKSSDSTGKYLRESGLDTWDDMGPAQLSDLSAATLVQFSDTAQKASRIQKG